MTDKKQINLRLDEKLLEKLDRQAEKEQRPRNNMIEYIITKYLENNSGKN